MIVVRLEEQIADDRPVCYQVTIDREQLERETNARASSSCAFPNRICRDVTRFGARRLMEIIIIRRMMSVVRQAIVPVDVSLPPSILPCVVMETKLL